MNKSLSTGQGNLNQKAQPNRVDLNNQQENNLRRPQNTTAQQPRQNPAGNSVQQAAKSQLKKWLWRAAGGSAAVGGSVTGWIIFS